MLVGLAAPFALDLRTGRAPTTTGSSLGATGMLVDPSVSLSANPDTEHLDDSPPVWPQSVFRVGFSFFVGFVVAFALRMFLKIALLAAGFMLLCLFGLQHAGLIEIKWKAMEEKYNTGAAWMREQTSSTSSFLAGYLPASGAGALGIAAGLRRRSL